MGKVVRDYTAWITDEYIRKWRECHCPLCHAYASLLERDKAEQERTGSMTIEEHKE